MRGRVKPAESDIGIRRPVAAFKLPTVSSSDSSRNNDNACNAQRGRSASDAAAAELANSQEPARSSSSSDSVARRCIACQLHCSAACCLHSLVRSFATLLQLSLLSARTAPSEPFSLSDLPRATSALFSFCRCRWLAERFPSALALRFLCRFSPWCLVSTVS